MSEEELREEFRKDWDFNLQTGKLPKIYPSDKQYCNWLEKKLTESDQQNKVELIPCECGHNVPEQFAYGTADSGYTCADCMITYKSEENKEKDKTIKELDGTCKYFKHKIKSLESQVNEN